MWHQQTSSLHPDVALLAEGVDRNLMRSNTTSTTGRSPSSRRAWIEITGMSSSMRVKWSPSSRRAWIEIYNQQGGVDIMSGRPPRGGRG